jgi:hypothetical protein
MQRTDAYLERLIEINNLAFEHGVSLLFKFVLSQTTHLSIDPLNLAGLGVAYKDDPDIYSMYSKAQFEAAFTGAGRVFGVFVGGVEPQKLAGFAVWYEPGREFLDEWVDRLFSGIH